MRKFLTVFAAMLIASSITIFASDRKTVGNWETAIYLDNLNIVTRVAIDRDNEVAVKLKEFSEAIGYAVEWIENQHCVILTKDDEEIKIFIDEYYCERNGLKLDLKKPVFIDFDSAYLPQSFLTKVVKKSPTFKVVG